jgi:hypothetical protein
MVQQFEDFLPKDRYLQISDIVRSQPVGAGVTSSDPNLPSFQTFNNSLPNQAAEVLDALHGRVDQRFEIVNHHVNVQVQGFDGAFHVDMDKGCTHALSWYCHAHEWTPAMGGWLLVGNDLKRVEAFLPLPNSAVLLPSKMKHCPTSPNLAAGTLVRYSFTLKLKQTS